MVWSPGAVSVEFRDVPQRRCFSMLIYIQFDELLSEIVSVSQKEEFKSSMSA
mgnify:CR=1 FL=1